MASTARFFSPLITDPKNPIIAMKDINLKNTVLSPNIKVKNIAIILSAILIGKSMILKITLTIIISSSILFT
ncbi:hypothetical protein BN179_2840003 [Clostridioides difficile T6]|nr:hypothetical protein BN179_2840003 [Clostridioides difficile T6]